MVWRFLPRSQKVTVEFADQAKSATANTDGRWQVKLEAMPPSAEPRTLIARGTGPQPAQCRDVLVGEVWLASSGDDGKTWTTPERLTPASVHPADLCLLPSGHVLLVMGDRRKPYGVLGIVGDNEGRFDWERRFSLVTDAVSGDCGYPTSVVLRDGRVLTAYYATRVTEHPKWGVHCGAVVFQPPLQ